MSVAAVALFLLVLVPIATTTAVIAQPEDVRAESRSAVGRSISDARVVRSWFTREFWRAAAAHAVRRFAQELAYVQEMRALGYSPADPNVLFALRKHGATPDYIRSLAGEGLTGVSTDDLTRAVSHGVTSDYVESLKELGYAPRCARGRLAVVCAGRVDTPGGRRCISCVR
jgi:hypothetical protein